jgi:hypothetical protein
MVSLAHCPECGKRVIVTTVLRRAKLDQALESGGDIEVVCFRQEHRWKLDEQDKAYLRSVRS